MFKLRGHFPVKIWCFMQLLLSTGVLSSIQEEPSHFLMKAGDTVRFICKTEAGNCNGIDWTKTEGSQSAIAIYKNSTGPGMLNHDRFPRDRYNVDTGDNDWCALSIRNLDLADSGLFGCIVSRSEKDYTKNVVLVVFANPSCSPNSFDDGIASGDKVSCSVNMQFDLIMSSHVQLTWFNSGLSLTSIVGSGTGNSSLILPYSIDAKPGDTFGFQCRLSLHVNQISPFDDGQSPREDICSFKNQRVLYGVTEIEFNGKRVEYMQGENVFCTADGLPPPSYEWTDKAGKVVSSVTSYTITNSLPGDMLTCTATNVVKGKPYSMSKSLKVVKGPLMWPPLIHGGKGSASSSATLTVLMAAVVCLLLGEM